MESIKYLCSAGQYSNTELQIFGGTVDLIVDSTVINPQFPVLELVGNTIKINQGGYYMIDVFVTVEVPEANDYLNLHIIKNNEYIASNINSADSSPYTLNVRTIDLFAQGDLIGFAMDAPEGGQTIITTDPPAKLQINIQKL